MERRFASDRREIVVARWKDRERETFPRNGTAIIKGEGRGGGGRERSFRTRFTRIVIIYGDTVDRWILLSRRDSMEKDHHADV